MEKRIIIGVLVISIVIILASFIAPVKPPDDKQFLPWQIELTPDGNTRVFGLTLERSTLQDAENSFHGGAEVSLFVPRQGEHKVEAYFDKVVLGGFSAKLVLVMAVPEHELAAMYGRGTRISSLGSGSKRVSLAAADLETVFTAPISSIAYLTRARLDEDLLQQRFGEPAQRIHEPESGTSHWLYPEKGLDVAVGGDGQTVLQYVSPQRFPDLLTPLLKSP